MDCTMCIRTRVISLTVSSIKLSISRQYLFIFFSSSGSIVAAFLFFNSVFIVAAYNVSQ